MRAPAQGGAAAGMPPKDFNCSRRGRPPVHMPRLALSSLGARRRLCKCHRMPLPSPANNIILHFIGGASAAIPASFRIVTLQAGCNCKKQNEVFIRMACSVGGGYSWLVGTAAAAGGRWVLRGSGSRASMLTASGQRLPKPPGRCGPEEGEEPSQCCEERLQERG